MVDDMAKGITDNCYARKQKMQKERKKHRRDCCSNFKIVGLAQKLHLCFQNTQNQIYISPVRNYEADNWNTPYFCR